MQELAQEVARLADAIERSLQAQERRERDDRAARLKAQWHNPIPRVGVATFLQAIPGLAAKFDVTVPPEFVASSGDDELEIACPCGQTPVVRAGRLVACDCGRWFLHDGNRVHVALSPWSAPADVDAEPCADDDKTLTEASG